MMHHLIFRSNQLAYSSLDKFTNSYINQAVDNNPDRMDDIVLVKDENLPRNQWIMVRGQETFPSDDGLVIKMKLAMVTTDLDLKSNSRMRSTLLCITTTLVLTFAFDSCTAVLKRIKRGKRRARKGAVRSN